MPTIAEPRDIYRTIEVVYPVIGAEEWQKSHNVRFLPDLVRITWKDGELQRVEMSGQRIYKTRRSFSDNRDSCSFYPSRFFGLDAAYSRSEPPAWLVEFVKEAEFFGLDAAYSRSEPPAWLVEFVKEAECPE